MPLPIQLLRRKGLEMTNNILIVGEITQNELRSEYDSIANEYERKLWFDQSILGVARLRKQLMSKAQGKILDVACGTGLNFHCFAPGSDITGIDLSPGMLEVARQKAVQLRLNVNLAVMDAQKLDFADGSFDMVVSTLSTCTFTDPIQALHEMGRVCRPRGKVLLLEHGHSSWPWIAEFQDRHVRQHYQDNVGCRWNQDPLDLVQTAGLKVLTSKRAVLGILYLIEATPG
jgi:ubiquinone/menaquinone biosynthesis C-methylase UbiE